MSELDDLQALSKQLQDRQGQANKADELRGLQETQAGLTADQQLRSDPSYTSLLKNIFRFSGHSIMAGIADDLGMPVETLNMAGEFARTFPGLTSEAATSGSPLVAPLAVIAQAASAQQSQRTLSDLVTENKEPHLFETGSSEDIRKRMGSYATKPSEEGIDSGLLEGVYNVGEYVGAAAPFGIQGAVKKGIQAVAVPTIKNIAGKSASILNDLLVQPGAVGFLAESGREIGKAAGSEGTGEAIGATAGILRSKGLYAAFNKSKQAYSWIHDALGFGTGAEGKVQRRIAQEIGGTPKEVLRRGEQAPSDVYLPNDIKLRHDGLIALRREVMKTDRELAGAYDQAESALADSIRREGEFSQTKFTRVEDYIASVQHEREVVTNLRMLQAINKADQTVDALFPNVVAKGPESQAAQSARALAVKNELELARDDSWAVTQSEWDAVDKNKVIDPHGLYDTIDMLEAEAKNRPRPDKSRFPSDIIDKFYKTETNEEGEVERVPLYGTGTRLGHMIDAASDIEYAIRVEGETAGKPPDPVRLGYLKRLAKAVNEVKFGAEGAETDPNLKRAIAATKYHHETFTGGPVGKVLGFREGGDPVIPDSNTIRHFLAKGPAGIDSYNALQRALARRTAASQKTATIGGQAIQKGAQKPQMQHQGVLEDYLRQDFHDNAFPGAVFNPGQAQRWLSNHAGPMLSHPELRKEMESVIESEGRKTVSSKTYKKTIDEIEKSAAHAFLNNEPGKMFNSVINSSNQYQTMKELIGMTLPDKTGRATRGLAQMALDRMLMDATVFDGTLAQMERLSGKAIRQWVEKNEGLIKALEEAKRPSGRRAVPKIRERFDAIAQKADYLELFRVKPDVPKEADQKVLMMPLTHLMAAIAGADVGAKLGRHAASLQTAHIGSVFFRRLAEALTPDRAKKLLRQAFLDEDFFNILNTPITPKNAAKQQRLTENYLYALGAPVLAHQNEEDMPEGARQAPDGNYYLPDPNRPGKYLRVDRGGQSPPQ